MRNTLIICDLEATCWDSRERSQTVEDMEIIEIGAVVADLNGRIFDRFTCLVRPTSNSILSSFCTELTGISQAEIDTALQFPEAISGFDAWLSKHQWRAWASWGAYDRKQLKAERDRHGLAPMLLDTPHLNLKRPWRKSTKHQKQGLRAALSFHGHQFEGTAHRALDDTLNICRLIPHIDRHTLLLELEQVERDHSAQQS